LQRALAYSGGSSAPWTRFERCAGRPVRAPPITPCLVGTTSAHLIHRHRQLLMGTQCYGDRKFRGHKVTETQSYGDTKLRGRNVRGHNVTGTQCNEEGIQCNEEGTQCNEEGTQRYGTEFYGDIMLRGRNVTGTQCYGGTMLRGHCVTGTYLYGLGTNCNNEGTLFNTLGTKCNGDTKKQVEDTMLRGTQCNPAVTSPQRIY